MSKITQEAVAVEASAQHGFPVVVTRTPGWQPRGSGEVLYSGHPINLNGAGSCRPSMTFPTVSQRYLRPSFPGAFDGG
jgi:hypothetical protein